jgi:hypothetical protein
MVKTGSGKIDVPTGGAEAEERVLHARRPVCPWTIVLL